MFKELWEKHLNKYGNVSYFTGVIKIDYAEFQKNIFTKNLNFANYIIQNLCEGKFFLVKKTFSDNFVQKLKKNVKKFWKENPDTFFKILDGCKDFHRVVDPNIAKNYSVNAVKHATFFFPWNEDPCSINKEIFKRWDLVKQLSGLNEGEFRNNIPSDFIIDRIQVAVYPPQSGELETHSDPINNTKIATNFYLSSYKNNDFSEGGFYCVDKDKNEINIETEIDVGDMGMFYGTLLHGVKAIDKNKSNFNIKNYDWNSGEGRWFLGLNTIDSDLHPNRTTTQSIK